MTVPKIMALTFAAIYVAVSTVIGGFPAAVTCAILQLPAIGLICFADGLSDFTGYVGKGGTVDQSSPEFLIAGFGWILLIGLPCFVYFNS
ncbi:MAG: hypothetical protein F9B45_32435 [Phycisphaera sp. RhM]|nr:hypothetical protein [Phycisphaera sp. RhM]